VSIDAKDEYSDSLDPWGYNTNPEDAVRKKWFEAYVGQTSRLRVIDLGIGTGYLTRDLPAKEFVGIDSSATAVDYLNSYWRLQGIEERRAIQGSVLDGTIAETGIFDLVIATGVFYEFYLGENSRLLNLNLANITRPGSELLAVHISDWRSFLPDHNWIQIDSWEYPYRDFIHDLRRFRRIA
jgi:SAM-dependent methyltransferase